VIALIGIVFFLVFLWLGTLISNRLFPTKPIYIKIWSGLLIGLFILAWGVVPFSFLFGFHVTSNLLALFLLVGLYFLTRHYTDRTTFQWKFDGVDIVMYCTILPIFLIIVWIFNNHVIVPLESGYHVGQSTYGDLSMHLGIITSIAEQGVFPPDYSIFPGKILAYPFLVNSLSSSLYLLGTPLRWAVLLPSYVLTLTTLSGFFILCYEVLKNRWASAFASILFFFNGGFGFIYFLDFIYKEPSNFTQIFHAYYHTPTNFNEKNIRWSNIICDMMVPQRTTLIGWAFLFFVIWLLYVGINTKDKKYFIGAGLIGGLMPMLHTHSYLGLGIVALSWGLVYLSNAKDKKEHVLRWLYFFVPAGLLSLPQLLFWTLPQTQEGSFLQIQNGWGSNAGDIPVWFWIKNVGIVFILLIPALFAARKRLLGFYVPGLVLFLIANFVVFQPNLYDNNKLFYIWYAFSVILVTAYIWSIYQRMRGMRFRSIILVTLVFFSTFSSLLTIGREIYSGKEFLLFGQHHVEAAEFVKRHTPTDALFVTAKNHNNAIAALAGRNVYVGTDTFLAFHGINTSERTQDIRTLYSNPSKFEDLAKSIGVDYLYYSDYELEWIDNVEFFRSTYPVFYENESVTIFAISSRAMDLLPKGMK
jgi:hypothetical protein